MQRPAFLLVTAALALAAAACDSDSGGSLDDTTTTSDVVEDSSGELDTAEASDTGSTEDSSAAEDTSEAEDTAVAEDTSAAEDTSEAEDTSVAEDTAGYEHDTAGYEEDTAGYEEDTAAAEDTTPAATPAPVGCVTDVGAGHHVFSCGDISYDVEIPAGCAAGGCGLLLDVHGWTMSADEEEANTQLRARVGDLDLVLVQPTAPSFLGAPTWNLDNHAGPVFDFVEDVDAALVIDASRRHVMGFSQGGGMTWRLICTHPEFFASGAPIGAIEGCSFEGDQAPASEVDLMVVHGRQDAVVNYQSMGRPQIERALAYWPFGDPTAVVDEADRDVVRYETPGGSVLEVWEHDYTSSNALLSGHCFPGSPDTTGSIVSFPFGCQQAGTFVVSDEILAFFAAHEDED